MPASLGVPRAAATDETRAALTPDVVERLQDTHGVEIRVASGVGTDAYHTDDDYEAAGATVVSDDDAWGADIVLTLAPPPPERRTALSDEQAVLGLLQPLDAPQVLADIAKQGATALPMELVPRISRAQSMDVLSAMSSLAGYRAALEAALRLPKFFPLMSTAAGTIRPASVLVVGAGVAGLQAIATAKRLGAKVRGYDIRDATREEIESLGASFVELELDTSLSEGDDGYAKELEQAKQERQPELLRPHIAKSDVVITTALIPGRPAPLVINEAAVKDMAPGSVVVDLAAPNGGNCALTEPGETVTRHDVHIMGPTNLPATMPVHASELFANTVRALLDYLLNDDGTLALDLDDEVADAMCAVHNGTIRNERVRSLLDTSAA
ncbi:NAD(P)(+) transhydrogenase (Re/Si-specific) subunit alpha [Longimonas halophila]|uniref:proton-translocating NAD(P)(+) transhydrogenase n=1 Tax=Longimonas halophila TaxID=1469170 RepID=A0A2H3P848_9BACT|nr:Re/Si-specific NAD(P)(+) transhydrogenase subunit alpha [Longimonas halophila]PEN07875.1 NAD(P)(+) transhydrogenase (Re/Si-specific) subunit alpha [Longimonas halophila]